MKQTDNSSLSDKVALRIDHLPGQRPLRVLDCFAGYGKIWKAVKAMTDRDDIDVLAIDRRDDVGFHLPGDNTAYLHSLDLSKFGAIDLDAYGCQYAQLKVIFDRQYHGAIYATFIQSIVGAMPHGLLCEIGFTKQMIEKSPALFAHRGWEYFREYLALHGIKKIYHRSKARKHYLAFDC